MQETLQGRLQKIIYRDAEHDKQRTRNQDFESMTCSNGRCMLFEMSKILAWLCGVRLPPRSLHVTLDNRIMIKNNGLAEETQRHNDLAMFESKLLTL